MEHDAHAFDGLGVRATPCGGELRVWSAHATAMELCIFDAHDSSWVAQRVPMTPDAQGVWSAESESLVAGARYSVRADGPTGPTHAFNPALHLTDPYANGLTRTRSGGWRAVVQDDFFDWGGTVKPARPLADTVVYEAHVKGLSKLNPRVPGHLRGSYAGLAHPATIDYLLDLGVTAVELLPVQQFATEQRLGQQGLHNYWGYNTVNFFMPHTAYASKAAQSRGPAAVIREFKGMVRLLHEAGIEVILDVVYNHTAEEGRGRPTLSMRGLDNASYYRQDQAGRYLDVTGCGNTLNTSATAVQRLILDSLHYWANDLQIDGFRFDLAAALARGADHDGVVGDFDRRHPLLDAITEDPLLAGVKLIAEPWDVGAGGWQVGAFPKGWVEWNDGYRDRVREFWLTDLARVRTGATPLGAGALASKLTGSSDTFAAERRPLASLNFVTAHDGFTLADLVSFDHKHNVGNGENNNDGTDDNHSFNHGVEGVTTDEGILAARRKTMRNLLGTLLLSAGVPMLTAGDEFGRSQRGNNNAYCRDSELTWLSWPDRERPWEAWQRDLHAVTRALIRLRRQHPALRPSAFGGTQGPDAASRLDWFSADGHPMSSVDWDLPGSRTLQLLATAGAGSAAPGSAAPGGAAREGAAELPERGRDRILLIVHGQDAPGTVTLPVHGGIGSYQLLWDSVNEPAPDAPGPVFSPATPVTVAAGTMQLYQAR
ncbi:MAG: glycogen debranching protein GlgX [Microbacteriaceae bacterium]